MNVQTSSQSIDDLILGIESVIKNRCPLLDADLELLEKVLELLNKHKRKWTRDNTVNLILVIKAIELLTRFFVK
jgi:hypothetical protein